MSFIPSVHFPFLGGGVAIYLLMLTSACSFTHAFLFCSLNYVPGMVIIS